MHLDGATGTKISWGGINLYYSGSSTVANNTCSNNGDKGIGLYYSGSSMVANNTCSNNGHNGILLYYSGSSMVENNTFTNCGLDISEDTIDAYLSYTVENNWVNGKKLGFYTNLDSTIIVEPVYGQLILVNCTNVTVRDQIINNTSTGLFLYSCTYSVIINNTLNNNRRGISLSSSGSSTVANNTCSNNGYKGIYLRYSGSSTVANNTCSNNGYGIGLYYSSSSTVANNTCSNNDWEGISPVYSDHSTVANNTCNNNWYGILLYYSDFCVVTYSLLQENRYYGVYLRYDSDNNLIHHNTFVDNNLGGTSQAFDDCTNNFWYDTETLEGNYWSDWSGTGSYTINGYAGSIDLYPLDEPAVYLGPPVITDIIHSPSTPTELDTISINATVTSPYGVQSVTFHYRVNCGIWIEVSMTLISGDLYSVIIGSFAVSDTIEYYISAIDDSINHHEATEDNGGLFYSVAIDSSDTSGPSITSIVYSPPLSSIASL
ncbi:hypothetical protein ES708_20290 [subsurface metagenome]